MSRINKRFEKLLRKDRFKSFSRYLIYTALVVLLIIATVAYSTGETTIIEARVIHIFSEASEEIGERFYITVQLNPIRTKRLRIPRSTAVKIGDRVKLIERSTNLFDLKKYTFQMVVQ